jgi:integrase/recombinase XerC/integrase/recombinase XerD
MEEFISSLGRKETTGETYRKGLNRFFSWLYERSVKTPAREDIIAYREELMASGLSPLTVSWYVVVVRRFFVFLEGRKIYPNVAQDVGGPKKPKGFLKDELSLEQIKSVFGSIDRSTRQGKRDFAILNLMVRTGLRISEVVKADVSDIRQKGGATVLWILGKNRDAKDEFVVLTPETIKPIEEYRRALGPGKETEAIFVSLSRRNYGHRLSARTISFLVKDRFRKVGILSKRLTAHSLRHTAITLSLLGGASIQEAQALGRHASILTTMTYAHNLERIAKAAEYKIAEVLSCLQG